MKKTFQFVFHNISTLTIFISLCLISNILIRWGQIWSSMNKWILRWQTWWFDFNYELKKTVFNKFNFEICIKPGMNSISIIFSLPEVEAAPKRATGGGKYEAAWINEFWGDKYGEVRNKWACNCWRWDEAWWSPCGTIHKLRKHILGVFFAPS